MNSSQQSDNSASQDHEQANTGFALSKIPAKYWALAALLLWGAGLLFFGMIRLDSYGMDEGGAMGLLLAWSVAQKVVIPVTILGGPDIRGLLFWPVALYWPGSMVAAKIFTMITLFGGAYALYRWSRDTENSEVALIATGLLLISPLVILQIDSVAAAPFLLAAFGLGYWLDKKYRASPHSISSLYFLQMLLVAATITLHPMGLAYPLAMAWQWWRNPKSETQKKQVWLGLAITSVIILVMQLGWIGITWFADPLIALGQALVSVNETDPNMGNWMAGVVLAGILIAVLVKTYRRLPNDLMGSMLLAALVIGLLAADRNWAIVATVLVLYKGIPLLIAVNRKISANGFAGQRGVVMLGIMVLSVLFMRGDKMHGQFIQSELLSPVDELIRTLAKEADDHDKPFIAASQWPARTMLVCRRDVLHLPPARETGEQLLKSIKGITHIVFDHRSPHNTLLNKNLSEITGATQTLAILQAGVIIKIRDAADSTVDSHTAANTKADTKAISTTDTTKNSSVNTLESSDHSETQDSKAPRPSADGSTN